jgi:cytochrome c oxidase cbb3-type subunit 1
MHPYYIIRALGGLLFLVGALIMAYNVWRTLSEEETVEAAAARTAETVRQLPIGAVA